MSRGLRALALITVWAGISVLVAAPADFVGRRISAIKYKPEDQPLVETALARAILIKAGDTIQLDQLSHAIERLYATGRYTDIVLDASLEGEEVVLTFETTGTWFIGRVTVSNVPEPPNQGQLVNAAKLELGTEYTEESLITATQNLEQVLRGNGFYRPDIVPDFEYDKETQQINLNLGIQPGQRAQFSEPIIKGDPQRTVKEIVGATRWKKLFGLLGYKPITENRIQQGLDRIRNSYQKKDHLMAKVNLDEVAYDEDSNRARPVLTIDAGPKVRVTTTGTKVSRGRLKQLVPVFQEQSVDRDLLVEGRRNLIQFFQAQGYFDAEVEFDMREESKDKLTIEYDVERGDRYKLVHMEIAGNKYFDNATVVERLNILPASLIRYRYGRYSEDLLRKDLNNIRELYRNNGFRNVQVDSRVEQNYKGKQREVAVFITIDEGPQWFVSNLEMVGVNLREVETVQSLLQSIDGQPYSELNVVTDRDSVLNYYFNNGFPDASFDYLEIPGPGPNQMQLKYLINEGRRQFVRRVIVSGLDNTDPKLVRDRITLQEGDPLSQARIIESQRSLYDLGIFARVDTAVQNPDGQERDKYVLYQMEEARRYSLTGGIGAEIARIGGDPTNLDAPAGTAGFSPRVSLGVSRQNAFGVGHTVSLRTRLSSLQRRAVLSYFAPQFRENQNLNLTFTGLFDDSRDVRTFSARRWESTAQLGQKLSRANTIQYRFTIRRVSVDENTLKITPQLIPLLSQPVRIGILSSTFISDRRDDPIDSRRGMYNSVDFGVAGKFFGSQSDFARLLVRNSTYHRLGRDLVVARTTILGQLAAFNGSDVTRDVPLPERFFAGGAVSHRGFPENQAGPRDLVTGFPIGGKALLINGTELRFPLIGDNIGGVFFHDAGNVYSSISKISLRYRQRDLTDFNYMVHAVGFGIRYRTPVGPIRVDLAYSVNSPRFIGFEGTREELLFGGGRITQQRINRFQFHFSLGQTF